MNTPLIIWFGFFFSLGLLLVIARRNLWLGICISAYVLGLFSLSFAELWQQTLKTLTDPSILLLALAVGFIPMIGGIMESGHLMDDFVNNVRMKRKFFMALTAAFIGMLPIPGGALLSAPPIERSGKTVPDTTKTAINVWFRHVFLLIYPLGMLLTTTSMAKLNLYYVMLFLLPGFIIMVMLGYFFFLRQVDGKNAATTQIYPQKLIAPVTVILIAPVLHFTLMTIFPNVIQEIPLLIGVTTSLVFAISFDHTKLKQLGNIAMKMKPWNFALIIIGVFLFLHIFEASATSKVIADADFSKTTLFVAIGFLLGFATGRVQLPVAILLPIYLAQYERHTIPVPDFAIMFFAVYQGYIISPVHPCVSVSLAYFKTNLKDFYKKLAIPAVICLLLAWITGAILL